MISGVFYQLCDFLDCKKYNPRGCELLGTYNAFHNCPIPEDCPFKAIQITQSEIVACKGMTGNFNSCWKHCQDKNKVKV